MKLGHRGCGRNQWLKKKVLSVGTAQLTADIYIYIYIYTHTHTFDQLFFPNSLIYGNKLPFYS